MILKSYSKHRLPFLTASAARAWVSPLPILVSIRCYSNDSDLVWLLEHLLHLFGGIFLSPCPCFHHLTHHSEHFNKALLVVGRGLAGAADKPINKAHSPKLVPAHLVQGTSVESGREGEEKSWEGVKQRWTEVEMQMKGVFLIKFTPQMESMTSQAIH